MSLSASALISVDDYKVYSSMENASLQRLGIDVYATDGTAATVTKSGTTLTLTKTAGTGTSHTISLASGGSYATLATLVAYINTFTGWAAALEGWADAASADLVDVKSVSCLTSDGMATLMVIDNLLIENLINYCSSWIEKYCRRAFHSTTYTRERYDGGGEHIFLRNYPIISVESVSVGELYVAWLRYDDINVWNARASITATGLKLDVDKTSYPELTFATYTTIKALIDAANALGSPWIGEVYSAQYWTYPSSYLIQKQAQWLRLSPLMLAVPSWPLQGVEIEDMNIGVLYYQGGIAGGDGNVYVTYTAGYADIPDEVKTVCCQAVDYLYKIRQEDHSMASERSGDYSYTSAKLEEALPEDAIAQLKRLRRPMV